MKSVKAWILELSLADKREKDWRDLGEKLWGRYKGEKRRRNSFNIFWSNTETMLPAVYNSAPSPDVRRRFKDDDPLGKAVSEVLERSLEFSIDTTPFNKAMQDVVLDVLVPGRGVARERYVPTIQRVPKASADGPDGSKPVDGAEVAPDAEAASAYDEAVEWEQTVTEHVQWDDFRFGPGKCWAEVTWIAFRHRMGRAELKSMFGKKGEALELDEPADEDLKKHPDESEALKVAEVWEIWDKENRRVLFISKKKKDEALLDQPDPLGLQDFFPCPRPVYIIADTTSLIPVPLFTQYQEQADELDKVSARINKLIEACKLRGVYDATMRELSQLMTAGDNVLVPIEGAAAWAEKGFDRAILWMPIEQVAKVLKELYIQREQCKQVIYELTGMSDIIRGASDPNETLGAQQLKSQWGGQRMQQTQREIQRFIRDLVRIKAEIISERFQDQETIKRMTGLQFPTDQEVQAQNAQIMAQAQQQAQAAMVQGQPAPPPPQIPQPVTWEQIFAALKDDRLRTFKVDIETDSTISANIQQDMAELQELLTAITNFIVGIGPAVMQGFFPVEAAKQIILTIARRSKMGSAVEDALDKIQQPAQQGDPKQMEQIQKAMQDLQAQQQAAKDQNAKNEIDFTKRHADLEVKGIALDADRKMLATERQVFNAEKNMAAKEFQLAGEKQAMGIQRDTEQATAKIDKAGMALQQQADGQVQTINDMLTQLGVKIDEAKAAEAANPKQDGSSQLEQLGAMFKDLVMVIQERDSKPRKRRIIRDKSGKAEAIEDVVG